MIDATPTPDEMAFISAQLDQFNARATGRDDLKPVELVIRDDDQKVIAGLKGLTTLDWLYVGTLWVDEKNRGNGFGRELLEEAEAIAKTRNCIGACLTSFSFQAPEFYRSHGYLEVGRIEDYPIDARLIMFAKRF